MSKVLPLLDQDSHEFQLKNSLAENQFKWFYDNEPLMHFSVDVETGLILDCNKAAVDVLGYTKDEMLGLHVSKLYSKNRINHIQENLIKFRREGKLEDVEQEMMTKSGRAFPIILNSNAIRDEDGFIVRSQSTITDISKLKAAQRLLQQQKKELERANKELENFVSICSHDLQAPLGTIKLSADIVNSVLGEHSDPKVKQYLGYIKKATDRMSTQIKDLLEHARLGENVEKERVDIQKLYQVVTNDMKKDIIDKNATITAAQLPEMIIFKTEFRLLLQNLISNALKYGHSKRKPTVHISAEQSSKYPEHYLFSVKDNGIGIDQKNLKEIFTIFKRLRTDSSVEDGSGIGLAHCDKIVSLHDGQIWATSEVDVGSTFYFTIKK